MLLSTQYSPPFLARVEATTSSNDGAVKDEVMTKEHVNNKRAAPASPPPEQQEMSQLRMYKHVKHTPTPKLIGQGTYCQVFQYNSQEVTKVIESGHREGLSPSQLRECNFYFRLAAPVNELLECKLLSLSHSPSNFTHALTLSMPRMDGDLWMTKIPRGAILKMLPHIVDDISCALHRMHLSKILHRDIKPGNILYTARGSKFFLIDFGATNNIEVQTKTTDWCTYMFCAPEAAPPKRAANYTFASDVYSFAASIINLIFNKPDGQKGTFDWKKFASEEKWSNPTLPWKEVLVQGVDPDPEKRCTLTDIRRAFGLSVSETEPWNQPLPLVNIAPASLQSIKSILNTITTPDVDGMERVYTWMAEVAIHEKWDKLTFLNSVQLFNDYLVSSRRGPIVRATLQCVALSCMSISQKVFEDFYADILDIASFSGGACTSTDIYQMEVAIWVCLGYAMVRRPVSFNYQAMPWEDLVKYVCSHSI